MRLKFNPTIYFVGLNLNPSIYLNPGDLITRFNKFTIFPKLYQNNKTFDLKLEATQ